MVEPRAVNFGSSSEWPAALSFELQTQLVIARQLGFGKESLLQTAEALAEETGKMTWAMMQKL